MTDSVVMLVDQAGSAMIERTYPERVDTTQANLVVSAGCKPESVVFRADQTMVVESERLTVVEVHDLHAPQPFIVAGAAGMPGPPGPTGATGPAGPSTQGIPPIAYSYGDAGGAIFTPTQSGTITLVRLTVSIAFNGVSPQIILGTLALPSAVIAANENDPTNLGEYETTPDLHINALESVRIVITPGAGATQGSGTILLTFVPD